MKPLHKSKTVWFNSLAIGLSVAAHVLPAVAAFVPGAPIILAGLGAVNLVLRYLTTEPLAIASPPPPQVAK